MPTMGSSGTRQRHVPSHEAASNNSTNRPFHDSQRNRTRSWSSPKALIGFILFVTCGIILRLQSDFHHASNNILDDEASNSIATTLPKPTHHACDGFEGIYHIQSGDVGGAAATIFFQFVIAQLMYAEQYGYKPWVFFNNISHHVYDQQVHNASQTRLEFEALQGMQVKHIQDKRLRRAAYPGTPYAAEILHPHTFSFTGDGVWEHYFEPVSDFFPGDVSCQSKPLLTMDLWSITPGLHIYAPWTPRMWRYDVLPNYMQQRHLTLRQWLTPQRIKAHAITKKYIRVKSHLWDMAEQVLASSANDNHNKRLSSERHCIGMHVRWSDKGGGRRRIEVDEFLPYVERFLQHGGNCIMVATDASDVLKHIAQTWPLPVRSLVRSQGDQVLRSNDATPVFESTTQRHVSHHRTNTEVLVDILALSQCRFLLHGHSAVSDAAMYLNQDLIYQSVNLEDPDDFSVEPFGDLVKDVLVENIGVSHSKYFPLPWWQHPTDNTEMQNQLTQPVSADSCNGYRGILHIAIGGGEDFSFGMTFFHFILNQLLYADKYKLKPWIHMSKQDAQAVFDEHVHGGNDQTISLQMRTGMKVENLTRHSTSAEAQSLPFQYPGDMDAEHSNPTLSTVQVSGNGIWNSYFSAVSTTEELKTCTELPMLRLDETMVTMGLHKWAPWSVKAFKYSGIPDELWLPDTKIGTTPSDIYLTMRTSAHELVTKYYHPLPYVWKRVQEVNPVPGGTSNPAIDTHASRACCLAVHIRQGDKEGYGKRKVSRIKDYLPYIEAFFRAAPNEESHVFLATDSWRVIDAISEKWPESLTSRFKSQGDHVVRSVRWVPPHLLEPHNRHRVNLEALVDILALSRCQFLLHGFSTVSEASIYVNKDLIEKSVNLDASYRIGVADFERVVRETQVRCGGD